MYITILTLLPIVLLPLFTASFDFITVARTKNSKKHSYTDVTPYEEDFTILVPIFGDISYLRNINFLKQYGNKVLLCTTSKEKEEFNGQIEEICKQYGFRVFRSEVPLASDTSKIAPWIIYKKEGPSINKEIVRDEIMRESFYSVTSKYCVLIDADTVAYESFYKLVGIMKEKDYDVASVRVIVSKTNTLIEKLQSLEYDLAMDARKLYPWLTSGAGGVAKTQAMREIMSHHSLYFSGGDIEIGKLGEIMNYKVGHIYFNFYTDVPSTFRAWFKQRLVWAGGEFRLSVINAHTHARRYPFFFFYSTILVYGGIPIRWYEVITKFYILPIVIVIYWFLIFAFHWKKRAWWFLFFPLYSLFQVMIIIPLGIYMYFRMSLHSDIIGLIRLRSEKTGNNNNIAYEKEIL